ncbi:hypothetical protein CISIN_1g0394172mg, partial [Citrus sinensis]
CWDSLIQIQACSGEIILFFLNGETYLGDGCCNAIRTIRKKCWPNMIDTLGFTAEEGDVLEGYCDHETPAAIVHTQPAPIPVETNSGMIGYTFIIIIVIVLLIIDLTYLYRCLAPNRNLNYRSWRRLISNTARS